MFHPGFSYLGDRSYSQVAYQSCQDYGSDTGPFVYVSLDFEQMIADGGADAGCDVIDLHYLHRFNVEPVSLVQWNAPSRWVRARYVFILLKFGHVVSDGGRTYPQAMLSND